MTDPHREVNRTRPHRAGDEPAALGDSMTLPDIHAWIDGRREVPALRISLEHGDRVLGHGEPAGTLRTTSFELMRAIGGRRSPEQIKAMDWDGDPDAEAVAIYGSFNDWIQTKNYCSKEEAQRAGP